uniref:LysR family transcriptional regulator n=1 Tax=Yoonia rhodophyticola TaxID=3137370 RepID=A0AAN0MM95_9RHOB
MSHQTLRRLVYFATIADVGSIRGAAAQLGLSVPVVSEALSQLEAELDVSLATRTTPRFELTAAGLRTQAAAQKILQTAYDLTDTLSDNQPLSGTLGITLPVELAGFWLPAKIRTFGKLHPDIQFDIDVTDTVLDLHAGPIELAIRTDYIAADAQARMPADLQLVVVTRQDIAVGPDGAVRCL